MVNNSTASKRSKSSSKASNKNEAEKLKSRKRQLKNFTEDALQAYFRKLNGHKPTDVYRLVLSEVEEPLFKTVMQYTEGNQTLAAEILGINRATLRKKLKQYELRG